MRLAEVLAIASILWLKPPAIWAPGLREAWLPLSRAGAVTGERRKSGADAPEQRCTPSSRAHRAMFPVGGKQPQSADCLFQPRVSQGPPFTPKPYQPQRGQTSTLLPFVFVI